MTDRRLLVVNEGDGALYRIELDAHALVLVADFNGLSILDLTDDAQHATALSPIRDPMFHETFAVAHVADRYLTVSSATPDGRPPYSVLSVPGAG